MEVEREEGVKEGWGEGRREDEREGWMDGRKEGMR